VSAIALGMLALALASPVPEGASGAFGPASTADPGSASTSDVRLIDPGSEPRTSLTWAPAAGTATTVVMVFEADTVTTIEDTAPIATRQALTMTWHATVAAVLADGSVRTELTLESIALDDVEGVDVATEAILREQFQSMAGLGVWTVTDAFGRALDGGIDAPEGMDALLAGALGQSVEALSMAPAAFPAEPVGLGAAWVTMASVPATEMSTASLVETLTSITAIEGTVVSGQSSSTFSAEPGVVADPWLPPGTDVEVLASRGTSTAEWTGDLASLRMASTVTTMTTDELLVTLLGRSVPMTNESQATVTIRSE
jgi:hypothetical protein